MSLLLSATKENLFGLFMKGIHSLTLLWGIILMVSGNSLLSCINPWNGMGDVFCLFSFCAAQMAPGPATKSTIYRICNSHVQLIAPSSSHPYPSRLAETHLNRQSAEKLLGLEVSGGKKNVPWPHEGFGVFFSDVKNL